MVLLLFANSELFGVIVMGSVYKKVCGHLVTKPSRHQRNRHQEVDSPATNAPPSNDVFTYLGLLT